MTELRAAGRAALGLVNACHPQPVAVVTGIACALAVGAGLPPGRSALLGAAVLAGQLSVGWCNDAVDAERDRAAGRTGKPVAAGAVPARTVRIAAWVALCCAVPLSLAVGWVAGAVHLSGVAAAWAYDLGAKATVLSPLPYAVGFASLPAFVALALPGRPWPPWWVAAAGALLGVGAHLANVLPDIPSDLRTGVRGAPQRLGTARVRVLMPVPLVAATVLLAVAPAGGVAAYAWVTLAVVCALAAGAVLLGTRRPALPFAAAMAAAVADVALLLTHASALGA